MEQVCLSGLPEVVGGIITTIVTVASVVANIVKPDSIVGKIVHFAALNITANKK